jgi:hypothetical protein
VKSRKVAEPRGSLEPTLEPTARIQELPRRIEIRVGEKVRYSGVSAAGLTNPKPARLEVTGDVITLVGLEEGSAELMIFGGSSRKRPTPASIASPPRILVKVKR